MSPSNENPVQFVPRPRLKKIATCSLKQEAVLLHQNLEPNSLLSCVASRDFAMSGKFSPLPAK